MKLAMILSSPLPPREGIGSYATNLAKQLVRRGHTVHLLTRGRPAPLSRQEIDGINYWQVPFFPIYPYHVQIHNLFVQSLIRKLEPELDLLHMHSPLVYPPITSLPMIVTVHTPLKADFRSITMKNFYGLLLRLQTPISIGIENRLFQRADKLVSVAKSVVNELAEYGIKSKNVTIAGNGVDTNHFLPSDCGDSASQEPYFLTVGRLGARKGLEDLIDVAFVIKRDYPKIKFYIVGEGPLLSTLRKKVDRLGLRDQVLFVGHISDRSRLIQYYRKALIFIHPAHYEGLPTVLLEAMACGKPVITTAVSGCLDVIRDRENGLLVPPRSPENIAKAIRELIINPELASKLGIAAVKTIKESYSWEKIAEIYEFQYQLLLERGKHL